MKRTNSHPSSSWSRLLPLLASSLIGTGELTAQTPVDSEIVILVDGQTLSQDRFDFILDGVAQAFEQQSFVSSVASGPIGSIAASILVLNGTGASTAIPWMELSSASDLQTFADSVRDIPRTASFSVNYANAITAATATIASDVVAGTISQITIVEDASFININNTFAQVTGARDAALASGVDVINSLVYNAGDADRETAIQNFFDGAVIGGGGEATVIGGGGFLAAAPAPGSALADLVSDGVAETVTLPTVEANNLAAIPEPSVVLLGALSGLTLLSRRRQK